MELGIKPTMKLPAHPKNWINIKTLEHVLYLQEDLEECSKVSFDTETTGLTIADTVFGVVMGVGDRGGNGEFQRCYWFDFSRCTDPAVSEAVLLIVKDLFTSGKHNLIMHNSIFDIKMVKATWGIELEHYNLNDTMFLALLLQKWNRVGLKELTRYVLNRVPVWDELVDKFFMQLGLKHKDDIKPYDAIPEEIVFPYACEDAQNTYDLYYALRDHYRFEQPKLQEIYKLERCVAVMTANLELNGMVIDAQYFQELREKIRGEYEFDNAEFSELWGTYKNTKKRMVSSVESPQKLGNILFDPGYGNGLCLDQDLAQKTPTGQYSTNMDYLLRTFPDNEIIKRLAMFSFRNAAGEKIDEILENMMVHTDDEDNVLQHTIHTSYWQIKDTGRYGSSRINLQNITNDKLCTDEQRAYSIRRGFVAPVGYLYVAVDFKSFEVAILANASQDPGLVKDVLNGEDFHSRIGAIAYHRPYSDLVGKVDKLAVQQRTQIKKTSFLFIYGGGVKKAVEVNGLEYDEAVAIKQSIERAYPYMDEWRRTTFNCASRDKYIYTLCGRLRRIDPSKAYTTAVNTVCQGTAADVMKFGHHDLEVLFKGKKSRQAATIHDEIHLYLHPEDVDLVPEIVRLLEQQRFEPPKWGAATYVPLRVELSQSPRSWAEMHDTTVEQIMDTLRSMK